MQEQDLPPGGVTNFRTSMRELQILRRFKNRALKSSDMLEFGALIDRASEWFETFYRGEPDPVETPKQPA